VEQPAVIATSQAMLLDLAELERGPAMTAVLLQQPGASALVAEQHEVLVHHLDWHRQVLERRGMRDGLPEAAQILAARRARTGVREDIVLARHGAIVIGREGFAQRRDTLGHRRGLL